MKIFNTFISGSLIFITAAGLCACKQKTPSAQVGTTDSIQNQPVQDISAQSKKTGIATKQKFGPYSPSDPEYVLVQIWQGIKNNNIRSVDGLVRSAEVLRMNYILTSDYEKLSNIINDKYCSNVSDKEDCKKEAEKLLVKMVEESLFKIMLFSSVAGLYNPNPIQDIHTQLFPNDASIITLDMKTGLKIDILIVKDTITDSSNGKWMEIPVINNPSDNIFQWVIPCIAYDCYPNLIKSIYGENADTDISKIEQPLEEILKKLNNNTINNIIA